MLQKIRDISVAKWYDPFISIFAVGISFYFFVPKVSSDPLLALLIIFSVLCTQFLLEIFRNGVFLNIEDEFLSWKLWKRIFVKTVGVYTGIALILFFYWLIPEYASPKYLLYLEEGKRLLLPFLIPGVFVYMIISEYLLGKKEDGTYQLGLFTTLNFSEINFSLLKTGLLEWLVRLIFLSLNFTSAVVLLSNFRTINIDIFSSNFANFVVATNSVIFLLILFTILPGYLFSLRMINTTVKKIDSTWFAWTITLICYQPFIAPIFGNIFDYTPNPALYAGYPAWVFLSQGIPLLFFILGISILFFELVHLWAEATLGIRSSNLTNRGIITTGPFKYTKHPVYVSKCFGWFFLTLPFFNMPDLVSSLQLGILYLFIVGIYAGRCLAEERLLSTDENYRIYAEYMDKNGMFAFVGNIFPFMTFEWRYRYWQKHNMLNVYD